jgi:hypothetical protein
LMSDVTPILDLMTETEKSIIEFDALQPLHNGAKAQKIKELFGLKESRYYQIVTRLMLDPATLPLYPQEVGRWMRRRDAANGRVMRLAQERRIAS